MGYSVQTQVTEMTPNTITFGKCRGIKIGEKGEF